MSVNVLHKDNHRPGIVLKSWSMKLKTKSIPFFDVQWIKKNRHGVEEKFVSSMQTSMVELVYDQ